MITLKKHSTLSTHQKKKERVLYIVNELLDLKNSTLLTHTLSIQWELSERSISKYIQEAKELIRNRPQESTEALISKHIAVREKLYQDAEHSRDKLQCVESIAKLQGLDIKRIEINTNTHDNIEDAAILEVLTND